MRSAGAFAILALMLAAFPEECSAQTCSGFPWTVTATPTSRGDVVVGICGTFSGCRPRDPRFEVHASEIRITLTQAVYPNCTCLAVTDTFRQHVVVPDLAPGDYAIEVRNFYCTDSIVAGSANVTVGAAVDVPTLDVRGFAALALLMAGVAAWRLR